LRLSMHRPELERGEDNQGEGERSNPPIGRRALIWLAATCIACYVDRIRNPNANRTRQRILFGIWAAIFYASLVLFALTVFRWSWGWWL
jgi:hypothetical protein